LKENISCLLQIFGQLGVLPEERNDSIDDKHEHQADDYKHYMSDNDACLSERVVLLIVLHLHENKEYCVEEYDTEPFYL
jgi:hypothetical protein